MTRPLTPNHLSAFTDQAAWERVATEEAEALTTLLERADKKIMVIIVAAHSDPRGTTDLVHSVSEDTKKYHARQFKAGLLKRVEFLTNKIERRP